VKSVEFKTLLIGCLVLVCTAQHMFASPWPRKQGGGFVQIGFSTIGYNKVYDDRSQKQPIPADVRDNVLQVFADYGLTDEVTVTAMLPFKFLSAEPKPATSPQRTNSGIGDIDLALRYSFLNRDGNALAGQLVFGIPVGDHKDPNGLYLGDGEFNVVARILFGRSFHPTPMYLAADVGFQYRTQEFSHDVLVNLEAGYAFADNRLYLILLISGRESLSNKPTLGPSAAARDAVASGLGLLTNNQEYWAINPKLLYKFSNNLGIVASWATAVHGRNVAGGFVFAGGVFYEF
jgi:hypothetical protein